LPCEPGAGGGVRIRVCREAERRGSGEAQVVEKALAAWAGAVIRGKARRVRELRLERCAAAAIRQDVTGPVILHEDADDEVEIGAWSRCRQEEHGIGTLGLT